MIASMTGYGRSSISGAAGTVTVEIKSVNSRFLELNFRTDGITPAMEEEVRQAIKQRLSRGKVTVSIKFTPSGESQDIQIETNEALLEKQVEAVRKVQRLKGIKTEKLSGADLLSLPVPWIRFNVLPISDDLVLPLVQQAAEAALDGCITMRIREGSYLAADLTHRVDALQGKLPFLKEKQGAIMTQYEQRLRGRIRSLLEDVGAKMDEGRLLEEVAIYADKTDYTEELTRFESHLAQFTALLAGDGPVGRQLDFLLQEINREINTMASKANDMDVIDCVIWMKTELEKIREQVQNIE